MSNIVEFPLPTGIVSEEFIAELHSNAFRDLEMSLRDCRKMGDIAAGLMSPIRSRRKTKACCSPSCIWRTC
jgi:hypothetical protein